jgi:cell division protein YceG involved in septum cleavage
LIRKKLDLYALLVLASVIEKEERNTKNKPYVASVFVNRVAEGMQL